MLLKRRSQRDAQKADDLTFKSFKPGYIFLFGIASTLSDLPTGLPLIGFVGEMIHIQPSPVLLLSLLSVYVLVYVSPLIVLYVAYHQVRQWADRLGVWLNRAVGYFNHYALPPLVLGCGIWLVADAIIWQFWK